MAEPRVAQVLAILALVAFVTAVVSGAKVASRRVSPAQRPTVLRRHRRLGVAALGLGLLHATVALTASTDASATGIALGVAALALGVIPVLAWSLRRHAPRIAWIGTHRVGYGVVLLVVAHVSIVHPGPMAPAEPLLYTLALAIVAAIGVGRLVEARLGRRRVARP